MKVLENASHVKIHTVDGHKIQITVFKGRDTVQRSWEILRILGKSHGYWTDLYTAIQAGIPFAKVGDDFGGAIQSITQSLTPEEFSTWILRLFSQTEADGKKLSDENVFDGFFWGQADLIYTIAGLVIWDNWGDKLKKNPFIQQLIENLKQIIQVQSEALQDALTPKS